MNRLCTQIAFKYGWGFVNINLRPFYAEGSKTFGFEIAEDLGWRFPQHVVCPMAGGSLIGKIHKAFTELNEVGLVDEPDDCKMYGAQATGCNPITDCGQERPRAAQAGPQAEHDLQVAGHRRPGRRLLRRQADPRDRRLGRGRDRRGDRRGMLAAGPDRGHLRRDGRRRDVAVARKLIEQGRIPRDEEIVLCITGNGLKTQDAVFEAIEAPGDDQAGADGVRSPRSPAASR